MRADARADKDGGCDKKARGGWGFERDFLQRFWNFGEMPDGIRMLTRRMTMCVWGNTGSSQPTQPFRLRRVVGGEAKVSGR